MHLRNQPLWLRHAQNLSIDWCQLVKVFGRHKSHVVSYLRTWFHFELVHCVVLLLNKRYSYQRFWPSRSTISRSISTRSRLTKFRLAFLRVSISASVSHTHGVMPLQPVTVLLAITHIHVSPHSGLISVESQEGPNIWIWLIPATNCVVTAKMGTSRFISLLLGLAILTTVVLTVSQIIYQLLLKFKLTIFSGVWDHCYYLGATAKAMCRNIGSTPKPECATNLYPGKSS